MANGTLAASQLEMLSQSGTGIITITPPATNTNRAITLPDAAGTIQVSGNPISGTTGTFTGLVDISAAGAGQIQFPATQNASANANTLDDYEEGTWTPTILQGGGGITGTGNYVKIGRLVSINIDANLNGVRNGSVFQIGGIPFVSFGFCSGSFYAQSFASEGVEQVSSYVAASTSTILFNLFGTDAPATEFGNGYINISVTYTAVS